jgi:hypothetical protein
MSGADRAWAKTRAFLDRKRARHGRQVEYFEQSRIQNMIRLCEGFEIHQLFFQIFCIYRVASERNRVEMYNSRNNFQVLYGVDLRKRDMKTENISFGLSRS